MATETTTPAPADEFAEMVEAFRPLVTPTVAPAWEGPVPPSVVAFVEKCYSTKQTRELAFTDEGKASRFQAAIRAACEQHAPRLSVRFVRQYAQLVKDGKPVTETVDGKEVPVWDTDKLEAIRVSVSLYSPRGGGKRKQTTDTPATPAKPAPKSTLK